MANSWTDVAALKRHIAYLEEQTVRQHFSSFANNDQTQVQKQKLQEQRCTTFSLLPAALRMLL